MNASPLIDIAKSALAPQPTQWATDRARQIMNDMLTHPADVALAQIADRLLVTHTEGFLAGMRRSEEIFSAVLKVAR